MIGCDIDHDRMPHCPWPLCCCVLLQVRLFESVNFMEFARMLAAFSSRASTDEKLNFMFTVYDVDGDGRQEGGWGYSHVKKQES